MCMCANLEGKYHYKRIAFFTNCTVGKSRQIRGLATAEHLCGPLVSFVNPGLVGISLLHDPVDLAVLGVNLIAHIQGHVAQVTDDASHLL